MLRERRRKNTLVSAFVQVGQWILNSCGIDGRAWEQWMFKTEKQRQWHRTERLPLILLPSCSLTIGYPFVASAAIQGGSLRGTETRRGKGNLYLCKMSCSHWNCWLLWDKSQPSTFCLVTADFSLQGINGVQIPARLGESRVTLLM